MDYFIKCKEAHNHLMDVVLKCFLLDYGYLGDILGVKMKNYWLLRKNLEKSDLSRNRRRWHENVSINEWFSQFYTFPWIFTGFESELLVGKVLGATLWKFFFWFKLKKNHRLSWKFLLKNVFNTIWSVNKRNFWKNS